MEEIWKDIEGYENYQVSNMGRIKSLNYNHTGEEKILKSYKMKGYLVICLFKHGKSKWSTVHRLVAQAFIDNPNNLSQINHKNEIKDDNRVENLEWCDRKYNINYGTCIQRRKEKQSKIVYQYTLKGKLVREWPSTMEVERELGYLQSNISKCCLGKYKTAYGYIWRYAS